jgi:RHS repeat-associated protein
LQFISHEEGRIRFIEPTGTDQAGIEDANRSFEVALFGEKINSTATNKPGGFDSDGANAKVSMLNGTTAEGRIGPGVVLKVMAGDKIKAFTNAWYQPTGMDNTTDNTLQTIITNLLGQLTPGIAGKGTGAENVTNGLLQPGMQSFLNTQFPASSAPKAYLSWILLDEEQFTMVSASSGTVPVPQITAAMQKQLLQSNGGTDIEMTKNGYLYIYVSNESKGNVYFDDIRVEHTRGALLEETHYYPFGLTMAGISSKALKPNYAENKYKYNDHELQSKEFTDNSGLELYDYGARMHDPQLGRFWQIDPKCEIFPHFNPYNYCFNNPMLFVDPDGMKAVYNWDGANKGQYTDNGNIVSWDEVQQQYQIGDHAQTTSVMLAPEYESDGKTVQKDYGTGALTTIVNQAVKTVVV